MVLLIIYFCIGNCPPDKPRHYCLIPPCLNAKCPAYPDAKCVDNYCGGCNADFYVGDTKVNCGQCPPYKPRHYCLIPPCNNAKCPAYPDAKCVDNYCGGCNADFYVGDTKVKCACPPLTIHQCKVPPCDLFSNCPAYPKAKCVNNYCGGCFADFYLNGRKVDCKKLTPPNPCRFSIAEFILETGNSS
ncbi:neurogenic locus notch homolog 3-like isoform X1 [Paramuricea clavata]|uniref:Neurogenic locus notch homolog 3-like isoform X1 n=1 Tax=Paramuricea clavata TaxID=317549 RepID=A0A6S7I3N0_PARCT|nr:neurogenic locus notch homolog 3-like isoform X1 [Paramuricea clavata]